MEIDGGSSISEKPILFSGEMVRAILEGRKTQTRRVLSYQPDCEAVYGPEMFSPTVIDRYGIEQPGAEVFGVYADDWSLKCPYGQPGDRLWVRETFGVVGSSYIYKADFVKAEADCFVEFETGVTAPVKWKPSIHMPRKACRIILEVSKIRVERLRNIGDSDAEKEGINPLVANKVKAFELLWDSINAVRGFGWDVNPWVWVIEFKKENR